MEKIRFAKNKTQDQTNGNAELRATTISRISNIFIDNYQLIIITVDAMREHDENQSFECANAIACPFS